MIYAEKPRWYQLPLVCLLGFHPTKDHPGMRVWEVCTLCKGERNKR